MRQFVAHIATWLRRLSFLRSCTQVKVTHRRMVRLERENSTASQLGIDVDDELRCFILAMTACE